MSLATVGWPGSRVHDSAYPLANRKPEKTAEKKSISDPFDLYFSKQPA